MTAFGQTAFGQFWCFNVFAKFSVVVVIVVLGCCLLFVGCVQDVWASPPDPPPPDRPFPGPPKISLFFFPLPPKNSFFLPSLEGVLDEFGGVFEDRSAQMCTFGAVV